MTVHRSAETWVNLTIRPWPVDGSPGNVSLYRFAMQAWADTGNYRGLAEGRIPIDGYGDITRAMSSLDGSYEVDTWSVTILDTDGLMRGLLADSTLNGIDQGRWEVHVEMTSHEGRLAEVEPRTLLRGIVTDATPDAGRLFVLQCKDILGGHLRGFDLDALIPLWKLKDDFGDLADFPDAMSEQVAPLVYGEDSDHGTVDASGVSAEKGLVPVYYVGKSLISAGLPGTPPTAPVYAHPPSGLTVTPVGTGPYHTVRCGVTAVTTFGETTLSNIVTRNDDYPELDFGDRTIPHSSAPRRADWSWTPPDNVDGEEVIGYRMYVIDDTLTGTPRYRLDMNFNPAGNALTTFSDDGDDSHFKAMYPGPPGINTAQVAPGTPGAPGSGPMFFDTFVIAAGALPWDHVDFFGSDLAASGTAKRVLLDASTANSGIRNVQIIAPGDALWPNADNWLEVNGRRYTVFYTRGPVGQAHIDGQVAMALNICGYTEEPDGTGLLIDQVGFVAQHLLSQWCGLDPDALTYTNGATWNDVPAFSNGDPKLRTQGFLDFQNDGIDRMGSTLGPIFRFVINQPITLREWLAQFTFSTNGFWVTNHHGQLFPIYLPHTTVSPGQGTIYRDRIEIKQWLTPTIDRQTITELTYIYDYDSELQDWRNEERTIKDTDLLNANGGRPKTRERLEMRLVGDPDTAATSAAYWLELLKKPRRFQPFETSYRGLEDDLGGPVTMTHYDGIGTNGEADTLGIVARHVIALNRDTVILTALDVSGLSIPVMLGAAWAPDVTVGTNSSDATPEELALYGFWANDFDKLPDGSDGRLWR